MYTQQQGQRVPLHHVGCLCLILLVLLMAISWDDDGEHNNNFAWAGTVCHAIPGASVRFFLH
jgi:hypothetical protein